uniref:Uncharacterized protein n=1 Tax=Oryza punctata TaxID=4537 RepID=A0A0E0LYG8_ORYPU
MKRPLPGRGQRRGHPRDAVKDYLEATPTAIATGVGASVPKEKRLPKSTETIIDAYSGLRIRNLTASPLEITNRFADIRFMHSSAIKNLTESDNFSSCWATTGVFLNKGCAVGERAGEGIQHLEDERARRRRGLGVPLQGRPRPLLRRLHRRGVRAVQLQYPHCQRGRGFSVSAASVGQMMKMGVSVDFGICKGKRKDGIGCTIAINKRKGSYCKFHSSLRSTDIKSSRKYSTGRVELKGGKGFTWSILPRTIESKKSNTTSKNDVNRWVKKGFEIQTYFYWCENQSGGLMARPCRLRQAWRLGHTNLSPIVNQLLPVPHRGVAEMTSGTSDHRGGSKG